MALNARKVKGNNSRVEQPNLEPGGYPARLVQIIDYGLQPQRPFQGQDKPPALEIGLTYELCDEFMVDEKGNIVEDKPRWISETIPLHNLQADKAKSTQRYYALDPTEQFEGDFTKLLGLPCIVNVVNNKSNNGKVYDNVASLSTVRAKDAVKLPELVNDPVVFSLDEPDMEVFQKLPEWIQDKLKANLNFNGSILQRALGGAPEPDKPKPAGKPAKQAKVDQDDDNSETADGDVPW